MSCSITMKKRYLKLHVVKNEEMEAFLKLGNFGRNREPDSWSSSREECILSIVLRQKLCLDASELGRAS